jgi:hypothetical protein
MNFDFNKPDPLRIARWLLTAHDWEVPSHLDPSALGALWCTPSLMTSEEHRSFQETLRTAWNGEHLDLNAFERIDAMCRAQGTTFGKCIARLLSTSLSQHRELEIESYRLDDSLEWITNQLLDGEPHDELLYAATYRWWPVHGLIGALDPHSTIPFI